MIELMPSHGHAEKKSVVKPRLIPVSFFFAAPQKKCKMQGPFSARHKASALGISPDHGQAAIEALAKNVSFA